jgi:predicted nucleic acid-binding protein
MAARAAQPVMDPDQIRLTCEVLAGCERLLTDDLQHGRVIGGVRIENPFT